MPALDQFHHPGSHSLPTWHVVISNRTTSPSSLHHRGGALLSIGIMPRDKAPHRTLREAHNVRRRLQDILGKILMPLSISPLTQTELLLNPPLDLHRTLTFQLDAGLQFLPRLDIGHLGRPSVLEAWGKSSSPKIQTLGNRLPSRLSRVTLKMTTGAPKIERELTIQKKYAPPVKPQ